MFSHRKNNKAEHGIENIEHSGVTQASGISNQQGSKLRPGLYHSMGEMAKASQDARAIAANNVILGTNHLPKVSS